MQTFPVGTDILQSSFCWKGRKELPTLHQLPQQRIISTAVWDSFNELEMRIFKDPVGECFLENMLFSCRVIMGIANFFLVPVAIIYQDETCIFQENMYIFCSPYWLLASEGPFTLPRIIMQYSSVLFSYTEFYGG